MSGFEYSLVYDANSFDLSGIPDSAGVFGVFLGEGQPYLSRAANIRRRVARLLQPAEGKKLSLRERVSRVEWTTTGGDFEALLLLYGAYKEYFGTAEGRKRLRLHVPYCIRFAAENKLPRAYVTNRISKKAMEFTYGPYASRAAAERYCEAVLDLFQIRRCYEELVCYEEHPGCIYGEMKKCMAPCQLKCSADEYAGEALKVKGFFDTGGQTMLDQIAAERDAASAEMEFEKAAELHARWAKVDETAGLNTDIGRSLSMLNAVILQPCREGEVEIFLVRAGCISEPVRFSTLGIRAARVQEETGSSLFAQPLMLQAVPLGPPEGEVAGAVVSPEERLKAAVTGLEERAKTPTDMALLGDHLALLKRWYFRPEKSRVGRIFFSDNGWPWRRMLNAAAVLGVSKSSASLVAAVE